MKDFRTAVKQIKKAKEIVIGCHINPDGDTIGSLLSLGLGLKKMGKKVHMLSQDGVPHRYRELPGAKLVKKGLNKKVDMAISVDCGTKSILGNIYKSFEKADYVIEIDHHAFRKPFGNLNIIDADIPAVGVLVYELLRKLNVSIDKRIAQNILTSIIVETNSFRFPTVTPELFDLCSKLLKTGVDYHKLSDMVFWAKTREIVLLSGVCFSRCKFKKNGQLIWSEVMLEDFKKVSGKDEDVDAVADEIRAINTAKVVVLFREKSKDKVRVSLRSKGRINVALLAEKYGGGGHYDVAGCEIPNKKKIKEKLLKDAANLIK